MDKHDIEAYIVKNLWCLTYAAVVSQPGQNDETAVMAANTAVERYREAWSVETPLADLQETP